MLAKVCHSDNDACLTLDYFGFFISLSSFSGHGVWCDLMGKKVGRCLLPQVHDCCVSWITSEKYDSKRDGSLMSKPFFSYKYLGLSNTEKV